MRLCFCAVLIFSWFLLQFAPSVASASTVQRQFTPRFAVTARGDLLMVGNTVMTCPDSNAA